MKELVEVIARSLVDNPDEVVVTETEDEEQIVLNLTVAQDEGDPHCCPCCRLERQ